MRRGKACRVPAYLYPFFRGLPSCSLWVSYTARKVFFEGVGLSLGKRLSTDWEDGSESKGQGLCDLRLLKGKVYLDPAQLTILSVALLSTGPRTERRSTKCS